MRPRTRRSDALLLTMATGERTLPELVIALAILGIVAATYVQSARPLLAQAKLVKVWSMFTPIQLEIAVEHAVTGRWPEVDPGELDSALWSDTSQPRFLELLQNDGNFNLVLDFDAEAYGLEDRPQNLSFRRIGGDQPVVLRWLCGLRIPDAHASVSIPNITSFPPSHLPYPCR